MITVHANVVGSLLRTPELIEAQSRLAAGEIDAARFREIEDRAVCDAIAMQESAELEVVTDGEMRRQSFQSQMTAATEGFGDFGMDAFLWGDWHNAQGTVRKARPQNLGATGKLVRKRYLSADEFTYLKNKTSRVPKITLPSPGLWANFWSRANTPGRRIRLWMVSSQTSLNSCAKRCKSWCAWVLVTFKSMRRTTG